MVQDTINQGFVRSQRPQYTSCTCKRGIIEQGQTVCRLCKQGAVRRAAHHAECKSAEKSLKVQLREWYEADTLPAAARVNTKNWPQVVIAYGGHSFTYHGIQKK